MIYDIRLADCHVCRSPERGSFCIVSSAPPYGLNHIVRLTLVWLLSSLYVRLEVVLAVKVKLQNSVQQHRAEGEK